MGSLHAPNWLSDTKRGYKDGGKTWSGSLGRFIVEKRRRAVWKTNQRYQPDSKRRTGTTGETPLPGCRERNPKKRPTYDVTPFTVSCMQIQTQRRGTEMAVASATRLK